jgi:hypothetical protein
MPKEETTNDIWEDSIKIYLGRTVQFKDIAALESSWVPNSLVASEFILYLYCSVQTEALRWAAGPTERLKDLQFQKIAPNLTNILEEKLCSRKLDWSSSVPYPTVYFDEHANEISGSPLRIFDYPNVSQPLKDYSAGVLWRYFRTDPCQSLQIKRYV